MSAWRDQCVADGEDEPRTETRAPWTAANLADATMTVTLDGQPVEFLPWPTATTSSGYAITFTSPK